jgi:hypothetical protein
MILTNEDLAEFQAICREEGITLTDGEARIEANNLIRLYKILLRETPKEAQRRIARERAAKLTLLTDKTSRETIHRLKRRSGMRKGSNIVQPPLNW